MAAQAGLDFAALDTPEEYTRFIEDGLLLNTPPGIPKFIRRHSLPRVVRDYELIRQRCLSDDDVLVTRDLFDTVARIAGEKLGIPVLWVFLAPSQITTGEMRAELFSGILGADRPDNASRLQHLGVAGISGSARLAPGRSRRKATPTD